MSISQAAIARQVGVSRSAVSHVLNGRVHMVSQEVRDRILKVVKVSGYHRNALVQALRSNRTHVIGIIIPDINVSFFTNIILSIERDARNRGLQCFLCQSHSYSETIEKQISALREYRVDGVIVIPTNSKETDIYRALMQQKFPFVLLDTELDGFKTPFIGNHNIPIGKLAANHLLELRHRRIAYFKGYRDNIAEQRFTGYCHALEKRGIAVDPNLVVETGYEYEGGRAGIKELLKRGVKFTALITPSDFVALGAIQELHSNGLKVPEDVSIVGCGDLDVARMVTPQLTTLDQRPESIGEKAVALLSDIIENPDLPPKQVYVSAKLIVRNSTREI